MNKVVLVFVLLVGLSGESMFAKNAINAKKVNYLNSIQVAEYEWLAKKVVKKLKNQGLTDEHIIDAFMHKVAANEGGAQNEKYSISSVLVLIVSWIIVASVVCYAISFLLEYNSEHTLLIQELQNEQQDLMQRIQDIRQELNRERQRLLQSDA